MRDRNSGCRRRNAAQQLSPSKPNNESRAGLKRRASQNRRKVNGKVKNDNDLREDERRTRPMFRRMDSDWRFSIIRRRSSERRKTD